jgi:hypothetical protein
MTTTEQAEQRVTLDWGKEKVHLASGTRVVLGRDFEVEEALCGYVVGTRPKEGTEDEVDREYICKRCLKIAEVYDREGADQ